MSESIESYAMCWLTIHCHMILAIILQLTAGGVNIDLFRNKVALAIPLYGHTCSHFSHALLPCRQLSFTMLVLNICGNYLFRNFHIAGMTTTCPRSFEYCLTASLLQRTTCPSSS
jgi:hypothetical protein